MWGSIQETARIPQIEDINATCLIKNRENVPNYRRLLKYRLLDSFRATTESSIARIDSTRWSSANLNKDLAPQPLPSVIQRRPEIDSAARFSQPPLQEPPLRLLVGKVQSPFVGGARFRCAPEPAA